jgi:hypothetical protein
MTEFISKFWEKVHNCEHKNMNPDYCGNVHCGSPWCVGREQHCLDCNVYITECWCGSNNGMSGWPEKRWRKKYDSNL